MKRKKLHNLGLIIIKASLFSLGISFILFGAVKLAETDAGFRIKKIARVLNIVPSFMAIRSVLQCKL